MAKIELSRVQINELLNLINAHDEQGTAFGDAVLGSDAIPSFEQDADGEQYKVSNADDFELLVKCMGWSSVSAFEADTGTKAENLIGKFWTTMRDVVYVEGDDYNEFLAKLHHAIHTDSMKLERMEEAKKEYLRELRKGSANHH